MKNGKKIMTDRDYEQEEREIAIAYLDGAVPYDVSFKLYRKLLAEQREETKQQEREEN